MRVEYDLLDPTGNITILVNTPVSVEEQPALAARLMELEPETEQVGFLSLDDGPADISLRMAGGEFCGNASMSAAVISAMRAGSEKSSVMLQVSGAPELVSAKVRLLSDGVWAGTVEMPRPLEIGTVSFPGEGPLPVVRFDGICHVILEKSLPEKTAEELAPLWCSQLKADAIGLLFLDREDCRLDPLVYVPAAKTLCWENSCASGTTAVGAYLARKQGTCLTVELKQPGGSLTVNACEDHRLLISGTVRLRRHKCIDIM